MRFLKILFCFVVCLSLSVVVLAHPGRTDSSGGHTGNSTGEYHYHHGYSAHQHSDLDGDGDLDCPYNFVDKSDSSSSKPSSSEPKSETPSDKQTIPKETTNSPKETKEVKTISDYIWDVCRCLFFVYFVGGSIWGVIELVKQVWGR